MNIVPFPSGMEPGHVSAATTTSTRTPKPPTKRGATAPPPPAQTRNAQTPTDELRGPQNAAQPERQK